jgi:hypothetical protein
MVNNNVTFRAILKSQKSHKKTHKYVYKTKQKNKKHNIDTQIIKKNISKKDIILLSDEVMDMKLDDIQSVHKLHTNKLYTNKMAIIPILLDNKDTNYYSSLRYVEYGMYSIFMILKKNRNLEILDEADVNDTTLYKYFPQIDRKNIKDVTQKVLDNGLKIYVIILTHFIPEVKLEISNVNDPYEWAQFNAIVNINSMEYKEKILDYLVRMFVEKYKYNILSTKVKIDNEGDIMLYDIISTICTSS